MPLPVPPDFWVREDVRAALRDREVGRLFQLLTKHMGISQSRIGAAVGLEQGYVSRVIAGRKVTSIDVLERIADGCAMSDAARHDLGLATRDVTDPAGPAPSPGLAHQTWRDDVQGITRLRHAGVNRRELLAQAFGVTGYTASALRWFTTDDAGPVSQSGARTVGHPDVDTIREMASAFRKLDNHFGGGHARETVARYLSEDVAPLLVDGHFDAAVGRGLLSATAELTQLAGWQAYDMGEHGTAQRYLVHALSLARAADDQPLGAEILAAMSHQASYLGHPTEAIDLARAAGQAAQRSAVGALSSEALVLEAHGHARAGDGRACAAALHRAEHALDKADRSADPQWITYFDEAYLSAKFAHCFRALGQAAHAERFARRSLEMDSRYVRGRVFNLALLATSLAQQGDHEQACTIGGQALDLTANLKSARAVGYLRDLRHHLNPYRSRPAVRRFGARFDAVVGARR
jgi:transcriptional regulator with XRE-family HTH domain/tetratricopeptide (TPR) repeat protein